MVRCVRSCTRQLTALFLFFALLCSCVANTASASYEADELILQAEEGLTSAFEAVLQAEGAGANVSMLIHRLNDAAGLLAEAKIMVLNGDSGQAAELAGYSVEIADDVKDEALTLKVSALAHRDFVFKVSLAGSLVGVPVFLVFMFRLWRWFRGYYVRRILRLRPEILED